MKGLPNAMWAGESIKNLPTWQSPCRGKRMREVIMKTGLMGVVVVGNDEKMAMPWPRVVKAWPMAISDVSTRLRPAWTFQQRRLRRPSAFLLFSCV
jgi:hypothetical protein